MNSIINKKTLSPPPFCEKEILRYAGCRQSNDEITSLIKSAISKARQLLEYKVCYKELPVTVTGDICDFSEFQVKSEKLAANLRECETVILLAATVGIKIDRLIARYSVTSPTLAHILDALGTERIEALCDAFCSRQEIERGCGLKPRFSPGYGDLSLQTQKAIFKSLDCQKHIGLFLNDSLIMTPSKSVTAFAGVGKNKNERINKCGLCDNLNCEFRGSL